jgi:hypothetical protein
MAVFVLQTVVLRFLLLRLLPTCSPGLLLLSDSVKCDCPLCGRPMRDRLLWTSDDSDSTDLLSGMVLHSVQQIL